MSKHTPGPWLQGEDGYSLGNGVVYSRHANGNPKDICTIRGWGDECKHNAALIAAAPDLLVVAQEFLEALEEEGLLCECGEVDCRTSRARAAIAKARGEP